MSYVGLCYSGVYCGELQGVEPLQKSQALIAIVASEEKQRYADEPGIASVSHVDANPGKQEEWRGVHGKTGRVRFLTLGPRVFQSSAGNLEPCDATGQKKNSLGSLLLMVQKSQATTVWM